MTFAGKCAIVQDMKKPEILAASRKKRIAAGSGTSVEEINRLLKQFDQTRKMMKTVAGGGFQRQMKGMKRGGHRRK